MLHWYSEVIAQASKKFITNTAEADRLPSKKLIPLDQNCEKFHDTDLSSDIKAILALLLPPNSWWRNKTPPWALRKAMARSYYILEPLHSASQLQ